MTGSKNEGASQPTYKMVVDKDVYVTARDGVRLAVDVYRPDAPGKFPALLAISPYGKDVQTCDSPPQPFGKSVFEASIEAGNPCYYASRGYAYAIADLRGTGGTPVASGKPCSIITGNMLLNWFRTRRLLLSCR